MNITDYVLGISPKLDAIVFIRQLAPLFDGAPEWIRSIALKVFSVDPRVQELAETIRTLDKRSKEIYADKKRALAKGDVEMVKQVGQGKDIISILRTLAHNHLASTSHGSSFSARERSGGREGQTTGRRGRFASRRCG